MSIEVEPEVIERLKEQHRSRKSTKISKFEFQSLSIPLSAVRLSTLVLMD